MERCPNDDRIPTSQMSRFFSERVDRPSGQINAKIKFHPNQQQRGTGSCIKNILLAQLGEGQTSCSGSCGDCGCRLVIDSTFTSFEASETEAPPKTHS